MCKELHEYCEQEGISKDDIINAEIEQEHKEAEKRSTDFQADVDSLLNKIQASQKEKHTYFKEVLEGKHEGKKLVQQRLVIEFAEVIDYDKTKLVYEETAEDEAANKKYLQDCSVKIDKAALQFANELQKHETFCIEQFNLFFREYQPNITPNIAIKAIDMSTGKVQNINDIPPEVAKALSKTLGKIVVSGEKGEEKGTEVSV